MVSCIKLDKRHELGRGIFPWRRVLIGRFLGQPHEHGLGHFQLAHVFVQTRQTGPSHLQHPRLSLLVALDQCKSPLIDALGLHFLLPAQVELRLPEQQSLKRWMTLAQRRSQLQRCVENRFGFQPMVLGIPLGDLLHRCWKTVRSGARAPHGVPCLSNQPRRFGWIAPLARQIRLVHALLPQGCAVDERLCGNRPRESKKQSDSSRGTAHTCWTAAEPDLVPRNTRRRKNQKAGGKRGREKGGTACMFRGRSRLMLQKSTWGNMLAVPPFSLPLFPLAF